MAHLQREAVRAGPVPPPRPAPATRPRALVVPGGIVLLCAGPRPFLQVLRKTAAARVPRLGPHMRKGVTCRPAGHASPSPELARPALTPHLLTATTGAWGSCRCRARQATHNLLQKDILAVPRQALLSACKRRMDAERNSILSCATASVMALPAQLPGQLQGSEGGARSRGPGGCNSQGGGPTLSKKGRIQQCSSRPPGPRRLPGPSAACAGSTMASSATRLWVVPVSPAHQSWQSGSWGPWVRTWGGQHTCVPRPCHAQLPPTLRAWAAGPPGSPHQLWLCLLPQEQGLRLSNGHLICHNVARPRSTAPYAGAGGPSAAIRLVQQRLQEHQVVHHVAAEQLGGRGADPHPKCTEAAPVPSH